MPLFFWVVFQKINWSHGWLQFAFEQKWNLSHLLPPHKLSGTWNCGHAKYFGKFIEMCFYYLNFKREIIYNSHNFQILNYFGTHSTYFLMLKTRNRSWGLAYFNHEE